MRQMLPLHPFSASFFANRTHPSRSHLRRATLPVLTVAFLLLTSGGLWAQGVTTGGVDGVVTNASALPLAGVTVTAVHEPSGTTYQTTTRSGGVFTIGGMRVGGPYTVTATILGHRQEIRRDINVVLGQNARLSFALTESAIELEALTVEAAQDLVLNSDRTGAATTIPQEAVRTLPSVRRSTRDLTRVDPRNDGNFSFGGRNWLYNNITLDGSYFNNSFGLDDPAPGGQTATEPVPYDAVEQVTVQVAPFDVRQSGFTGASINTVTRSGTNRWKVSGFAFYRDQNLVGNSVSGEKVIANPDLSFGQYGFSLGGPIIQDKLFFFFSGELTKRDDPGSNFVPSTGGTPAFGESRVEQSVLDAITERMASEYNFATGPYSGFVHETKSNKALLKVDWNVSANHNIMFRYNRLDASRDLPPHPFVISIFESGRGPNSNSLPSQNSGYQINNELNSYAFEWNARAGQGKWANRLFASYNRFRDFREAFAEPFPTIEIAEDGITYTTVGHEPFSIENNLDTDVLQLTNDFTYFTGRHSLTLGANFESFKFFNSFNLFRHGTFGFAPPGRFDTLQDFFDATDPGNPAQIQFRDFIGTGEFKGEKFTLGQLGVYLQDNWSITPQFSLSAGLRVDFPRYNTDPVDNPFSRSLTARSGSGESITVDQSQLAGTQALWSPRVGFNWDITGDRSTQLRGGTGIFTGRLPFVWVGNVFSNPSFNPNIYHPAINPGVTPVITSGPREGSGGENFTLQQSFDGVAAMDPDFKWPQMWTTNIAVDQRLPWDMIGTLEFIYGKDINNIYMQNVDLPAPVGTLADGRPNYDLQRNNGADPFSSTSIYLLSNTDEGRNYNITVQLRKVWEGGLGLGLSYAYLDATNTLKSTEIASVLWSGQPTTGNPNAPIAAPSEFGQRHRIVATGTYNKRWSDLLRTSFGLFWEVAEGNAFRGGGGNRYSFLYSGDVNGDGANNDLIYIPESASDINLADPGQWNALNAFIEQDKYLSKNRGKIAERFGLLNPWYTDLSLRILQDFIFGSESMDNVLQVSFDFENLLNMFSSSWGVRKVANTAALNPLACTSFPCTIDGAGRPELSFNGATETFVDDLSEFSRWRIQLGIRYFMD
ncbi:MAG: TonB-dependent receptor [Gemmatimonadetes bacterium]|nr:TonB-dependent receptor [Gemmatimonadota bacterium]NNK48429.1 TonB-dependent receptor [Gemmatimonadota bacterium]